MTFFTPTFLKVHLSTIYNKPTNGKGYWNVRSNRMKNYMLWKHEKKPGINVLISANTITHDKVGT